jgi:tRNA U34 5-methylaminomethyl-2-thiouridine-forming methyltransferase MnmC
MNRELVITKDGSHTLFVPELNEHYHSIFGAIQESKHVFIKEGLNYLNRKSITIFEIGLGTGLNAILTLMEAVQNNFRLEYYAIEKFPLDIKIIYQLNYPELLKLNEQEKELFYKMHKTGWGIKTEFNNNFSLTKIKNDITEFTIPFSYDIVYFDAFAPGKQPEMWSKNVFQKLYNNLNPKGILTTYCSKGGVKRTLMSLEYRVESIPGPRGKREIIRAQKL